MSHTRIKVNYKKSPAFFSAGTCDQLPEFANELISADAIEIKTYNLAVELDKCAFYTKQTSSWDTHLPPGCDCSMHMAICQRSLWQDWMKAYDLFSTATTLKNPIQAVELNAALKRYGNA